jgi:hypothetical protein
VALGSLGFQVEYGDYSHFQESELQPTSICVEIVLTRACEQGSVVSGEGCALLVLIRVSDRKCVLLRVVRYRYM